MELNKYIDHTNLKADATIRDIEKLCDEAVKYKFASVCVSPYYVPLAHELLENSNVNVCTVIGFPLGQNTTSTKAYEAIEAINNGADEIDMVINIAALKNEDYDYVKEEIEEIMDSDKLDEFTAVNDKIGIAEVRSDLLDEYVYFFRKNFEEEFESYDTSDFVVAIDTANGATSVAAEKVFTVLSQDETEMEKNWNKRYRDNMEKMKSGSIYEVAGVVRNLSFKQKEKGLSTGEKKMLSNAKQILVSELVLAEHATQDEVEELINNKIDLSFNEYRAPQTNIDLNTSAVNKFIPFDDTTEL